MCPSPCQLLLLSHLLSTFSPAWPPLPACFKQLTKSDLQSRLAHLHVSRHTPHARSCRRAQHALVRRGGLRGLVPSCQDRTGPSQPARGSARLARLRALLQAWLGSSLRRDNQALAIPTPRPG